MLVEDKAPIAMALRSKFLFEYARGLCGTWYVVMPRAIYIWHFPPRSVRGNRYSSKGLSHRLHVRVLREEARPTQMQKEIKIMTTPPNNLKIILEGSLLANLLLP